MQFTVNTDTLKLAAEKMVARLNELGVVSKTGNPLVVDHGFEAIAALFGYRNQHVLRHALNQPEDQAQWVTDVVADNERKQELLEKFGYRFELDHSLDAWVVTFNGDEQTPAYSERMFAVEQTWDKVAYKAMTAHFMSDFTWNAMSQAARYHTVTNYLASVGGSTDLIPQLQAAGYTMCQSDSKRPYRALGDTSEASEDFYTEEQAAWRYAKEHFVKPAPVQEAQSPMVDAVQDLVNRWADGDVWGAHPSYSREDWQLDVGNGDTTLGYWDWVLHQLESELDSGTASAEATLPVSIDNRTRTDYRASMQQLDHEGLMQECHANDISYLDCIGKSSKELRGMLLAWFDVLLRRAADAYRETHFEQDPAQVLAAWGGWEVSELGHTTLMRCAVFLENPEPNQPSIRVVMALEFEGFNVTSCQVS